MTRLFLWLNGILLIIASGGFYYIISKTNPTDVNLTIVWMLIVSIVVAVWSITALSGYYVRSFLAKYWYKNKNISYILIRSERQGLLLGLLFGLQLALQGFLLFNVLSATILTIAILLLEFFFIAQESK